MHYCKVKMKDGREFNSPVHVFRPFLGWMTLMGSDEKLYFKDMESAVTVGGRRTMDRVGMDVDEIDRAREHMRDARKFGWEGHDTPKMEWE